MSMERLLGLSGQFPKPTKPLNQRDYCAIGRRLGYVKLHEPEWEIHLRRAIASHAEIKFCLGIPDSITYASTYDLTTVKEKCRKFALH